MISINRTSFSYETKMGSKIIVIVMFIVNYVANIKLQDTILIISSVVVTVTLQLYGIYNDQGQCLYSISKIM